MVAPALILLAEGSIESRVEQVYHRLRHEMQVQRPSISVHLAFSDQCPPSGPQVVAALANRGVEEMVLVPLDFTRVREPSAQMCTVLGAVHHSRPELKISLANPIGPAVELLNVLDVRLRSALAAVHAAELDGLVLSVPEWGDTRGNGLIARRARQWAAHHKLPVLVSHADGSGPDIVTSIDSLRSTGRRSIAVGSMFVAPTDDYRHMAELAMTAGALAVGAPLGADPRIGELAMARYAFAAMELLNEESEPVASQAL